MVVLTDNEDVGKLEDDVDKLEENDTTNGSVCCPATSLRFTYVRTRAVYCTPPIMIINYRISGNIHR